jgi:hypothetical protein
MRPQMKGSETVEEYGLALNSLKAEHAESEQALDQMMENRGNYEALEHVKYENHWIKGTIGGFGLAAMIGFGIWRLTKLVGNKKDEEGMEKIRLHPRHWDAKSDGEVEYFRLWPAAVREGKKCSMSG